ncbi:carbohydrate ABC transporter permease [Ruminococcaceae bacterium OttesenSCG-928-L11]|nr:carbohydrate ABC transporter permease [Ruminococcaceae bacterium OttesenSCG-928-L11]
MTHAKGSSRHGIRETKADRVFDVIVTILVALITFSIAYPLYFIVIASFSNPDLVASGQVILIPKDISISGYTYIFRDPRIMTGYLNTFLYTVLGTVLALCITIPAGYALSRRDMLGRGIIMKIMVFTMYFSGGLIPSYLIVKGLNLVDTRLVLIILGSFSAYNLIICKTFYESNIPIEVQEAADIDGCSIPRFFFSIVIPLSKATIAIMALYYAVAHWNDFFNGLIYVNKQALMPLQLFLRDILISGHTLTNSNTADPEQLLNMQRIARTIQYGVIIVSSLPILVFYPFIQKYFVKGVMVGSIKG